MLMPNAVTRSSQTGELVVDRALSLAMIAYRQGQRDAYPNFDELLPPGDGELRTPPFPATDNPMFRFLLDQAEANFKLGELDFMTTLCHVAAHCWMEGRLEGYIAASTG